MIRILLSLCLALTAVDPSQCFVVGPRRILPPRLSISLMAKKKGKSGRGGKGFGEVAPPPQPSSKPEQTMTPSKPQPTILQSAEGASTATPQMAELSPEERAKVLLKDKYGMKTLEEQQMDIKQREALEERRKKFNQWKQQVENENFDVMTAIPAPILIFIDRFLKIGVVVTGSLFIFAGLFITVEAWSKTSNQPLPENIDSFIVNIVEPNFTYGLLVLLGFSVSLGIFAAAQLSSSGANYKE